MELDPPKISCGSYWLLPLFRNVILSFRRCCANYIKIVTVCKLNPNIIMAEIHQTTIHQILKSIHFLTIREGHTCFYKYNTGLWGLWWMFPENNLQDQEKPRMYHWLILYRNARKMKCSPFIQSVTKIQSHQHDFRFRGSLFFFKFFPKIYPTFPSFSLLQRRPGAFLSNLFCQRKLIFN